MITYIVHQSHLVEETTVRRPLATVRAHRRGMGMQKIKTAACEARTLARAATLALHPSGISGHIAAKAAYASTARSAGALRQQPAAWENHN